MSKVIISTTMGDITVQLDDEKAPIGAENFIHYVMEGFYNGTLFHRIIPNFMVQGGGMLPGMEDKPSGEPIENEADNGLKNIRGSLSYARTMDPHSATTQFFINLKDNSFLDHSGKNMQGWGYAVFGQVVDGMDVVDAMAQVETTNRRGHQDVPVEDILITKTTLIED
ncbi:MULTISPECIES: peptidylprolyl isomerase [Thiomicrorhabdus]|uniref:Peptidyl-prolyl cis-trans isomerase n=1 Tax=Thiomicrorhabdus heinhorstiae TaxID=2748010 RepID=A0ABS0BXB0_9GAMM|nr:MULTISPECIES: peptidylprolyl isomerase [Thiomicrorhabdus]MBF6058436.1 peptidyl-prolyl cis-trans isomerase [Thiomicrorhabdus heinhorstiae]